LSILLFHENPELILDLMAVKCLKKVGMAATKGTIREEGMLHIDKHGPKSSFISFKATHDMHWNSQMQPFYLKGEKLRQNNSPKMIAAKI